MTSLEFSVVSVKNTTSRFCCIRIAGLSFMFSFFVVLNRAVQCKPGLSCLWKLIGDCCTVIHPVSNSSIR